jgi:glycosyltransferase involved in cell wall biosynthesis
MLQRAGALKNHVLAIAGPQGWDDTFNQFLITSDAHSRIKLLGYIPLEDMPSLYRFASAFIYPSIYEGFGLPVLEAMCSSAKVLTSSSSSLQEIAGDVVKTFDPNDEISMAESILNSLAMTKEISASYRKQCRLRAKQLLQESVERPSIVKLISHELTEDRCVLPSYSHL